MHQPPLPDSPAPVTEPSVELLVYRYLSGEPAAFESLVKRFFPLVMSAALRRTGGQHSLAQEVTQLVFIDLAKRLPDLKADERLGGWLHGRTIRAAADMMKSESRRKAREMESSRNSARVVDPMMPAEDTDISAHLDEALGRLSQADRDAVLLRFVDGHDFRSVGLALGVSEDTAHKRVSRALEKLRRLLGSRCAMPSIAAIALKLTTDSTQAAACPLGNIAKLAMENLKPLSPLSRFWPHGKAALLGVSAAGIAWAWPMAKLRPAPQVAATSNTVSAVAKAPSTLPHFPELRRLAQGLSVDEIVQGIAALAAGPNTRNARDRFEFYVRQLGGNGSGEAVQKLQSILSKTAMTNLHKRNWRNDLIRQWGQGARLDALNFLMRNLPAKRVAEDHDSSVVSLMILLDTTVAGSIKADNLEVCQWTLNQLKDPTHPYPEYVHSTLIESAKAAMRRAVDEQSKDVLALLIEGANQHQWTVIGDAPSAIGKDDKQAVEKLQLVADLLPTITSPAIRDKLQRRLIERLGKESFEDASALINDLTDQEQRLVYAELVASPPHTTSSRNPDPTLPIPQPQYRSRADWWLSLATPEKQPYLAKRIGKAWLDIDPDWGMDWLSSKISPESMLAFLEEEAGYPAFTITCGSGGPSPKENQRILTNIVGRVKQQFPESYSAFSNRLLKKHKDQPRIETLQRLLNQ